MKRKTKDRMLIGECRKLRKLLDEWAAANGGTLTYQNEAGEYLEPGIEWKLNSRLGEWHISHHGDSHIFTRFHNISQFKRSGMDCNPYTGKWNHLNFARITGQEAFDDFIRQVTEWKLLEANTMSPFERREKRKARNREQREAAAKRFAELAKKPKTVFLTTHRMDGKKP